MFIMLQGRIYRSLKLVFVRVFTSPPPHKPPNFPVEPHKAGQAPLQTSMAPSQTYEASPQTSVTPPPASTAPPESKNTSSPWYDKWLSVGICIGALSYPANFVYERWFRKSKGKNNFMDVQRAAMNESYLKEYACPDLFDDYPRIPVTEFLTAVDSIGEGWSFVVIDGMKGSGKSSALAHMCLDYIKHQEQHYALFIARDRNDRDLTDPCAEAIIEDPFLLVDLIKKARNNKKQVLIVVDDLHHFYTDIDLQLSKVQYGQKIEILQFIDVLWRAAKLGAKVVLTSSDYCLKKYMKKAVTQARIEELRLKSPNPSTLKQWIKDAARHSAKTRAEKNKTSEEEEFKKMSLPEEDLDIYCEVVGVIRTIKVGYLQKGIGSVKELTLSVFREVLEDITDELARICKDSDKAPQVRTILETLCRDQVVNFYGEVATQLMDANVIRPVSRQLDAYEFHTFTAEAVVRALLQKPVYNSTISAAESQGRGRQPTLKFLADNTPNFDLRKALIQKALGVETTSSPNVPETRQPNSPFDRV